MKNFLLSLNIILFGAVAYLYYQHFSNSSNSTKEEKQNKEIAASSLKIAYFDLDSLENHYDYFKEVRDYLKGRNDAMEGELNKMRNQYSAKVNDYNKRGPSLSQAEASQIQEDIGQMQNNFSQQQENMGQQLQNETMAKMLDVKSKIQEYLKTYSAQKGYTYVFATSSDDNVIYYKDSVRNITTDLVKLLNDKYKESRKK